MSIEKSPHDWFFKTIFSKEENTEKFLKGFLPNLYKIIKPNSLKLLPTEKQSVKREKFFLDLSFECKLNTKSPNNNAILYFVFEHKSYPDKRTPSQIAYYKASIMEEDEKNNRLYTPVIPIVFYHGSKDWNIPKSIPDLKPYPPNTRLLIHSLDYILVDLNKISSKRIVKEFYDDICLLSAILTLKNIFKDFNDLKPILRNLLVAETKDCIYIIINYIALAKKDLKTVENILEEVGGKEKMMTLTEKWRMEGLQQGIEEGIKKQLKDDIKEAIEIKFGEVMEDINTKIESIKSVEVLKNIYRTVIKVSTLEELKNYINNL
ncbi:Rpn family recombination-promoting nuclease/putative transposase [Sulfurihydrogenibium azorense]|uniref:Rpn family recombination-promoting nuclease/putative transposase n=1 Tax=Sulfurihydrogenibium azorense TaxID=309806 RepID=UPI00240998DE|nr:Rpn family recombination-promoting nuclease/putative transposase [Sulfurihydrogenibium azorense]MDM7274088.1 Rpn family recombination-promoting nuclease/putative transposase [Sulfurihydrogenibium azorense]